MAADGSVVIEILGDAADITNKLKSVASGAVNGLKTAFVSVTAAVTATSAAVGVFAKQALNAYGDYEQLTGGVETLFKDSADIVMNYANNAYKTVGLSANEYMETVTGFSASLLQSLGGDTEKAAHVADQAITDMADNANKMGTAMESIQYAYQGFAKQNYMMLDNLKLGYGGTKEEMQRLLADAEKLSGQKFDLSSYADIVEAIHVVQTEMGITGTTAKEAASTIQGSVAAAQSAWANLVTGIADENADLDALIDNFINSAATAADNIIPRITQILTGLGQAIQQMSPILSEQIPALVSSVLPALMESGAQLLSGLITGIITALPSLATAVPKIADTLITSMSANASTIAASGMQLFDMLVSGIQAGIPKVQTVAENIFSALIGYLKENLPQMIATGLSVLLSFSEGLRDGVGNLVDAAIELVTTLADGIITALPDLIATVPEIISNLAGAINGNAPKLLMAGAKLIAKLIEGIIKNIPVLIANAPKIVFAIVDVITAFNWLSLGSKIVQGLINGVKSMFSSVATTAQTLVQNWRMVISDLPGYFQAIGRDMIQGLINGIKSMAGTVVENVKSIGTSAVSGLKSLLGIRSPSRVARDEIGKMFGAGVAEGITDSAQEAIDSANSMAEDLTDALQGNLLDGLDIGDVTEQLWSTVEIESARLSAKLTVASNAPAEARAARDRTNAYQNAAANASLGNSVYPSVDVTLTMDGDVLAKKQVDPMRRAFAERPEVLDDD